MTIDPHEAALALSDIDTIARRVRQSRFYQISSLMLMLWGALTAAGYVATFLSPRTAGYSWVAVYVIGLIGSFVVSALGVPRFGARSFDLRIFSAFLMFFAFGYFTACVLGNFGPRELSAFWPVYFMAAYSIVGLWLGPAFVAIGLGIIALTLIGYFFVGDWFDLWMAVVDGGGLILGGLWMRRS